MTGVLDFNITSYIPKFEELSINAAERTIMLKLEHNPDIMRFPIQYIIEYSEVIKDKIKSDLNFYRNWEYTDEEIQSYIYNANATEYWKDWRLFKRADPVIRERVITITNSELNPIDFGEYIFYNL